jgi:hypothetical protein
MLRELFKLAPQHTAGDAVEAGGFDISVSMLEIYNEEVRDLLSPQDQAGQPGRGKAPTKLNIRAGASGVEVCLPPPPSCSFKGSLAVEYRQ